ncbi:hypothetical protein BC830DRAFT_170515 [Chytriomyces sp. MP71]|nr:hypothetical protein BC830DRAFT_170515 [Chytriomyces sp. MP71]
MSSRTQTSHNKIRRQDVHIETNQKEPYNGIIDRPSSNFPPSPTLITAKARQWYSHRPPFFHWVQVLFVLTVPRQSHHKIPKQNLYPTQYATRTAPADQYLHLHLLQTHASDMGADQICCVRARVVGRRDHWKRSNWKYCWRAYACFQGLCCVVVVSRWWDLHCNRFCFDPLLLSSPYNCPLLREKSSLLATDKTLMKS